MRYLGNKTNLLEFIDSVIDKYEISGSTFADLFAGTASVGDHFKNRYTIIANDYMYFSSIIARAKLSFADVPKFKTFMKRYSKTPFELLNDRSYVPNDRCFIYKNFTPIGNRMYFTEENAVRIDGMRLDIEEFYKDGLIDENEYAFLIASLIESVLKVANTSGTFQAFFKFWEQRSKKLLRIEPLGFEHISVLTGNRVYCQDANELVRGISGDIVYIDPPYTITQYANSYHVLETIARYDNPELFGKTGRRKNRTLSGYSNKSRAIVEFEDLLRQIDFEHVLISYSNQSIVELNDLINLAKRFAVDGIVHVETYDYREYATNNLSYKGKEANLKEAIIYFRKDRIINKSPLNYSGSKDQLVSRMTAYFPKHIGTFVDAMGGAFNVGANVVAMDKVVYNEYNPFIFEIMEMLINNSADETIENIERIVREYRLRKKGKEAYLALREKYNESPAPDLLFTLQIYAFQNMIRFNSSHKMNTPVGNNEFNEGTRARITDFRIKSPQCELIRGDFLNLDPLSYPKDTVFYFDPPYYITSAEYNDGKRGLEGWNIELEKDLLDFLLRINSMGKFFMLSNVLEHNGKTHHLLCEWIREHNFNTYEIGMTGIKYPRTEVLITNYDVLQPKELVEMQVS